MRCECCLHWDENVAKVNAPNMTLFARNPTTYKGYDGRVFEFCPWCGNKLVANKPTASAPASLE